MTLITYKYYEMNEDGIISEKEPYFITLKEGVDVKKVEKELGTVLSPINIFEYKIEETEYYKFFRNLVKDKFANSLPTFRSINQE